MTNSKHKHDYSDLERRVREICIDAGASIKTAAAFSGASSSFFAGQACPNLAKAGDDCASLLESLNVSQVKTP